MRGRAVRDLGLPLPPAGLPAGAPGAPRLSLLRSGRPLKRWRYVAAFGPDLMLCVGDARIGPVPQRWWAIATPGQPLVERTSAGHAGMALERGRTRSAAAEAGGAAHPIRLRIEAPGVEVDLMVGDGPASAEPVEVVSPSGRTGWAWTRKQAGVPARGAVTLRGHRRELRLEAMIDDSAGYHERRTAWRWSTGAGRAASGQRVAWNLVSGVHDAATASERTVWVDGEARELGPARFEEGLRGVRTPDGCALTFSPWAARERSMNLGLFRSSYEQPFGTFHGELPGGLELAEGYGVMEHHDVLW